MTVFSPNSKTEKFDHENDATIIISSPRRLIDGVKAKLAKLASSYQIYINGRMSCSPWERIMAWVWMHS